MAEVIGRAVLAITADNKDLIAKLVQVNKHADESAKHLKGIEQAINLKVFQELGRIGLEAVTKVAEGIISLGERGEKISEVSVAFDQLTGRVGSTAEAMLGALRAGTLGTVSDFELMKMANGALGSGLVKSSGDMQTLAEGATHLSRRMGVEATDAFETLTKAIATGRTNHLKQYGIFVDTEGALERYARAHGKAKGDLTMHEQAAARAAGVISQLKNELKGTFDKTRGFADQVEHARAVLNNFKDSVSVAIAQSPVLRAGMVSVSDALEKAFGTSKKEMVQHIADVVGRLAIGALSVAQGFVGAGRFITEVFNSVKVVFNMVLEALFTGVGKVNVVLSEVFSLLAKIPGQAAGFKMLADNARKSADEALSLAYGFKEMKDKAVESSKAANAGFDKVQEGLGKVKKAMQDAAGKAVEAGETIRKKGPGSPPDEQLSERARQVAQKIADAYSVLQEEIVAATKIGLDRRLAEIDVAREKEMAKVRQLTENNKEAYAKLAAAVQEKYRLMAEAARAGGDQIRDRTQDLYHQVNTATKTGLAKQLADIKFEYAKELQALEYLKANYGAKYTELAALVAQKYKQMADAARGENQTVEQLAAQAGFKTRAELEATAKKAEETYQRMKASGLFSFGEIQKAHEASEKAKNDLSETFAKLATARNLAIAESASTILRTLFGKSKAAAIAAALIDAAAAIVKVFAQYGFPWGIPMAAAIAVQTGAQISKIKSQGSQGFRQGTPGMDFQDFGPVSPGLLHGEEAIVPRGKAHLLAAEIAAALPKSGRGEQGAASLKRLDRIATGIDRLPSTMKRAFRDGLLLARA